jgi:hypothetical protein
MSIEFPRGVIPNAAIQGIENLAPGAEMLGYGFNIFASGSGSFEGAIFPLFDLGPLSDWTAPSGKVYALPAQVSSPGGSSSSSSASAFATRSEFVDHFSSAASVSGNVCGFSACFSENYSKSEQDASAYSWALVEADFIAWQLSLSYNTAKILEQVRADPDWQTLPTKFDPQSEDNILAFYRFFDKFGTHFISSTSAGGSLNYFIAVSTASKYSSSDIELSASFEYKGLIASNEADASAQWQNCAANWSSNRQSSCVTVPAVGGIVNWVSPAQGSYDENGTFAEWSTQVVQNPSRCKFKLTPIWALFYGDQWASLQEAFAAYGNNQVLVRAAPNSNGVILVNGTPIVPPGGYLDQGSWQVVLLDRKTLREKLNKLYRFDYPPASSDATFDEMVKDLKPYTGSNRYMLVTVTSFLNEGCNPNTAFYAALKSFGAGAGLDAWLQRPHACGGPNAAYALIGDGGSSDGIEGFTDPQLPSPWNAPDLTLNALLLPLGGSFSPTPYQP